MDMLTYICIVLFLAIASVCVVLRKSYNLVPAHELKRQAASGNELATVLYRAVSFGVSLRALLWLGILIGSAVGFVLLALNVAAWLSVILIAVLVWLNFAWLPKARVSTISLQITRRLTPIVVWKLQYLDRPLRVTARLVGRFYDQQHSGLYEVQDLLNLLDLQSQQADSRITTEEIALMRQVLSFGDRQVHQVMRPRKDIKSVALTDAIGPVLLDELHASGQSVFPVKKAPRSKEIVASLHLGDLGIHSTGTVQDYAHQGINYVNETDSLADALHAFFQTKQQLFVVIDAEQDYLGILTLEDILHTLIGQPATTPLETVVE